MLQTSSVIGDLFDSVFDNNVVWYPTNIKNDILKYDDRYELILEAPGVSKKDIKLKAEHDRLHIEYDNKADYDDSAKVFTSNRDTGKFERTYLLPDNVDNDAITAKCKNGVLTIKLPMTAKAQPKEISVG